MIERDICLANRPVVASDCKENTVDWDRIEGNWKQVAGKVKEQWGNLTDDDVAQLNGKREQLEGLLQNRYGYSKDKARQELDDWSSRL